MIHGLKSLDIFIKTYKCVYGDVRVFRCTCGCAFVCLSHVLSLFCMAESVSAYECISKLL